MLSDVDAAPEARTVAPRWRSLVVALAPTARDSRLDLAALTVALAAIPAIVAVIRDGPPSVPLTIATLAAGSSLAWAADDPGGGMLATAPISTPLRTLLRVVCVAAVAVVGTVVTIALLRAGSEPLSDRWSRLPEAAAAAGIALAVSLAAVRRGDQQAAPMGLAAGIIGTGSISVLAFRFPDLLPSLFPGPTHDRWWIVAAAGFGVAIYAGRDPARG